METKLQMTSDALGAINDLVQALAKDDEESAKRAFNINKGVSIAQAIMSTAQGVMNAFVNPVDVASGIAFLKSGIIATTGAAQIATIARTKFQPSGGGSTGGSTARPTAPSSNGGGQPANFNIIGSTGTANQLQTLQPQQQPIKAYVVSTDVTTQQSLDRNRQETATFG